MFLFYRFRWGVGGVGGGVWGCLGAIPWSGEPRQPSSSRPTSAALKLAGFLKVLVCSFLRSCLGATKSSNTSQNKPPKNHRAPHQKRKHRHETVEHLTTNPPRDRRTHQKNAKIRQETVEHIRKMQNSAKKPSSTMHKSARNPSSTSETFKHSDKKPSSTMQNSAGSHITKQTAKKPWSTSPKG